MLEWVKYLSFYWYGWLLLYPIRKQAERYTKCTLYALEKEKSRFIVQFKLGLCKGSCLTNGYVLSFFMLIVTILQVNNNFVLRKRQLLHLWQFTTFLAFITFCALCSVLDTFQYIFSSMKLVKNVIIKRKRFSLFAYGNMCCLVSKWGVQN